MQNGANALWVDTLSEEPHRIGDRAFVSGFPEVRNGSVVLTLSEIESTQSDVPLSAEKVDPVQLASGSHAFNLVSVEGRLIMRVGEAAQDQYVIASQGRVFSAFYRHPERGLDLPADPMRTFPLGSRVRVTGICVLDRGDQFRGPAAFHLLLRSSQDVAMLAGPSPVSVRNLIILLGVLVILVSGAIAKAFLLERKLRRQGVATASTIDRWRTRVIDGINSAIPLRETLSQITELLSLQLQAEYCWAEIELEGTFGNCPPISEKSSLEVVEHAIPARSGTVLGKVCTGFRVHGGKHLVTAEAVENAVRLAALAIETGGKYSDLVRRSEVDPLTGAGNRFAFDRALDLAIEREKESGTKFGLIYIDLDGFKQVNDQFGHQVGDRYLQEIVSRLKNQSRSNDLLARIGGDEFAVLVTNLNSGEELQGIAHRIQSCFEAPLYLDLVEFSASASVGCAVYPDDAVTRGALLECADTRMYQAKRQKRHKSV
ncbi:MAG TPA: GGDEF domain-containing protein, partial [Acidobacteriaceae bacterium]|nr:GGDEF domain-containing protein [Acidobacteriaceae bacterium]